jgi:hypothetical protein
VVLLVILISVLPIVVEGVKALRKPGAAPQG